MRLELQSVDTSQKLPLPTGLPAEAPCSWPADCTVPAPVGWEAQREQRQSPEGLVSDSSGTSSHCQERRSPPPPVAPGEQSL